VRGRPGNWPSYRDGAQAAADWPLPGFGASDGRCPAHLIGVPEVPTRAQLRQILGAGDWVDPGVFG